MVGTALDVTALALAEERFRTLFETAPYASVVVDSGGTIVVVNSRSEQLFGYSRDELIGKPMEELIAGSPDQSPLNVRAAPISGTDPGLLELRGLRKSPLRIRILVHPV